MDNHIKILYVDDEVINTQVFEIAFSDEFDVIVAENGKDGLQLIKNDPEIKFVIADMKMPKMNGLEFIKEAKKINKDLPCIILSGYQETQEIFEALESKLIISYQFKPLNKPMIDKLITENA